MPAHNTASIYPDPGQLFVRDIELLAVFFDKLSEACDLLIAVPAESSLLEHVFVLHLSRAPSM